MTDEELTAAIREVQERARSRVPQGPLGLEDVVAADLMPLVSIPVHRDSRTISSKPSSGASLA
jgi:hypothetical protein